MFVSSHPILLFMKSLLFVFLLGSLAASAQNTGSVRGTVRDAKTGTPIAGAAVEVHGASAGATTDSVGRFLIEGTPTGYLRLEASAEGYRDAVTDPVQLTAAVTRTVDIALEPRVDTLGAVVVRAPGVRRTDVAPLSNFRLNTQEIEKSPGGTRDISKVVQNIPGVSATPAYRNDLIVRGGSPSENRFYLDRVEIPILNHFAQQGGSGGNASLVNSDFLTSATLYSSSFPVWAGGLSSVLDMRMGEGNSERFKARFTVGASDAGLTLDTPLGKDANLIAAYRVSYLQFLFSALKLPFLPTYQDAQFKTVVRLSPRDRLVVLGLGGYDYNRLNTGLQDATPSQRYLLDYLPENDQWSYTVGAVYTHATRYGQLAVVASTDRVNNSLQKWQNNDPAQGKNLDYVSNESHARLRVEYSGDLGRGYALSAGVGAARAWYDNRTFQRIFIGGTPAENRYSSDLALWEYAAWAAVDKRFFADKFRVQLSMRVEGNDYSSYTANPLANFSPRLLLSYEFAPRWTLNGTVGRFYQQPLYTTMGYRNPAGQLVNQEALRYIVSDQASLGVAWEPSAVQRLSVEGFYKSYDRYPMSLVDSVAIGGTPYEVFAVGAEPVRSVGKGRAYGVEILYRNQDLVGFRLNVSFTYYRSEFRKLDKNFKPTGPYVPSNWDNQRLFTILLSRELGKGWEAGLRWRYAGGAPYTPYNEAASMEPDSWNATHRPVMDYSMQNAQRYPPFHQLDLRVDKSWFFKKWTLSLYVDVQNLYNYAARGQDLLLPQVDPQTGQYVVKDGKYVPVYYPNTLGGTIVPTLGVQIEF